MDSIQQMNIFLKGVQALRDDLALHILNAKEKREVTEAIAALERATGVTLMEIQSTSRKRYIVNARIILTFYLRKRLKYEYIRIGEIQMVHHSTIIYHLRKYHEYKHDLTFKSKYINFRNELKNKNEYSDEEE